MTLHVHAASWCLFTSCDTVLCVHTALCFSKHAIDSRRDFEMVSHGVVGPDFPTWVIAPSISGSGWESNPPGIQFERLTNFEDWGGHQTSKRFRAGIQTINEQFGICLKSEYGSLTRLFLLATADKR